MQYAIFCGCRQSPQFSCAAPAPSPCSSSRKLFGWYRCWNRLWLVSAASALGGSSAETVPELAGDFGQRAHATGTGGLSALGLLGPVVCSPCVLASVLVALRCPRCCCLSLLSWALVRGCIFSDGSSVHVHLRVLAAG